MLHELLRSRQLQAAVSWVLQEHRGNRNRFKELFEPLEKHGPGADPRETAERIALYLLATGDHLGARLAFSMFPEPGTSKLIETAHVVTHPNECFEFEPLGEEAQRKYPLEPLIVIWSEAAQAKAVQRRVPPCVARLDRGQVFGLSFIPVTEDRRTCLNGFTHNPNNPKNIANSDEVDTIPMLCPDAIMGCFDGADDYGEGVLIGNHENFGHWILNHVARLALAESVPKLKGIPLVVGENISRIQVECLERLGLEDSSLIRLRKRYLARFNVLWSPMMPFFSSNSELYWAPRIVDFLRDRLGIKQGSCSKRKRRLYITRRASRWRRVLNEDEIMALLAQHGFEVVDPAGLSLSQQIQLAGDAEVIMGPFGAGMNLLLFAPRDSAIIEFKYHQIIMDINPALCRQIGQRYVSVTATPLQSRQNDLNLDFVVAPQQIERALEAIRLSH